MVPAEIIDTYPLKYLISKKLKPLEMIVLLAIIKKKYANVFFEIQ